MRTIKFRAWDKLKKRMIYDSPFTSLCVGDGIATVSNYVSNNGGYTLKSVRQLTNYETDNMIFMQYIGLKDCKNREGYFGDLVKAGNSIYEVAWNETEGITYLLKRTGNEIWGGLDMACLKDSKIIGDIYQNPELLEKETK